MPDLLTLPHKLDEAALTCRAIVETPAGRGFKFDYDPETRLFALAGIAPSGMVFPLAFGFVPGTLAEDGDPVDMLVIAEEDLPVGCLLTVKLLGVIEAEQTENGDTRRNDRLIGRAVCSRMHADMDAPGDALIEELKRFFVTYNQLKGKDFEVIAVQGAPRAAALVREATR